MSSWQHKGFDISLDGATFAVTIHGKNIRSGSLSAAKKAIDKHLDAKAREVSLNLPVVLVRTSQGVVESHKAIITGLDATTLTPIGENLDSIRGFGRASVMPDSEESVRVYRDFIEAEKAHEDAKQVFYEHCISVNFNTFGRSKVTHAEAVQMLLNSYKEACKP